MADEGFHEIQLNGKQLVFLFMTGTVVAVVIFLCGVLVGRGVRTPGASQATETSAEASSDPTAPASSSVPAPPTTTDGASAATQETLTYPDRLGDDPTNVETLHDDPPSAARAPKSPEPTAEKIAPPREVPPPAEEKPAPRTTKNAATSKPDATPSRASATPAAASSEPAGSGFVVQVAATKDRSEADAIARRLAAKGYPTFVTTSGNAAGMFRVRVGKYADRREADSIAGRLKKEEQFRPWITR